MTPPADAAQIELAEDRFADQLAFLHAHDTGPRPPGWRLTPAAVVTFICGARGLSLDPAAAAAAGVPERMDVPAKYIGDRALIERCVVTLAGSRALLLVGEPGTAKSMLSELLAAAVSDTSTLTVQGSAGTTEDQLRYGWNYALLLADGPGDDAVVPSPVLQAMTTGRIARIEEITRCLPEVQDALVPVLSERRLAIPELGDRSVPARPGFNVIATANLRDTGVSAMSAALTRRFNVEHVAPIADRDAEIALVTARTRQALGAVQLPPAVDEVAVHTLVTVLRDLRTGITDEGWAVEATAATPSTAEAVDISTAIALTGAYFPGQDSVNKIPGHLLGTVRTGDEADADRLRAYWDAVIRRRAVVDDHRGPWQRLWEAREDVH